MALITCISNTRESGTAGAVVESGSALLGMPVRLATLTTFIFRTRLDELDWDDPDSWDSEDWEFLDPPDLCDWWPEAVDKEDD